MSAGSSDYNLHHCRRWNKEMIALLKAGQGFEVE
jgi:hypothetical protein